MGPFNCTACGEVEAVEYAYPVKGDRDFDPLYPAPNRFECGECGARFAIEEDADHDGERYVDQSTPGERLP